MEEGLAGLLAPDARGAAGEDAQGAPAVSASPPTLLDHSLPVHYTSCCLPSLCLTLLHDHQSHVCRRTPVSCAHRAFG